MKGLFVKDFRMLLQRKQAMVLFVCIGLFMALSQGGEFVVGYLTMLLSILVLSTMNYDDHDNGMPFIMSLPITPKIYVKEKYLFCVIGAVTGWIVSVILYMIVAVVKHETLIPGEFIPAVLVYIPVFIFMISLMLPFQLKFGPEKSRIAIAGFIGSVLAIAYLAFKLIGREPEELFAGADTMPISLFMILFILAAVIFAVISYFISVKIIENKEF